MLFNKKKPTDVQQVYKTAIWLGVGEFQVFCNAWQAWFNEKPADKRIEPYFVDFLGRDTVPFWVRNYVRGVLDREDLREAEKKRLTIGAVTFYIPLIFFFILIMWALL